MKRIKRNYLVVILISISIFTMLFLAACSSKDNINITPSPETAQVVSEMQSDAAMRLVWLTSSAWVDYYMDGKRLAAVNNRLHELGCDFDIEFKGVSDDSYDSYQQGIDDAKSDGIGDLMWTGLGDGADESKDGTYYRQIKEGNLLPLDEWLDTDTGKELKAQYLPYEWELIEYEDHIYGVRNIEEQGVSYRLVLTGDNSIEGKQDTISISDLCDYLEKCSIDNSKDNRIYLDWKIQENDDTSYTQLGYVKLCNGIYMTSEGKVINIWEEEDMCRLWTCLANLKRSAQLKYDQNEELAACYEGKYPVALMRCNGASMDETAMYMDDGTKIPVHSYRIATPYLDKMENDVHGVTSWSNHKEEAKLLLTLVNTDKALANLLYYGIKETDYNLKGDLVLGQYITDTECPSNPRITHYQLGEAYDAGDKQTYFRKINKQYDISPAAGFVPKFETSETTDKMLEEVEIFYKKLLEDNEEPSKMIKEFQEKLDAEGYNKLLGKIQKQYDKWKKNTND